MYTDMHQLLISSEVNNVWSMTVTVLQRKASTQQIGLLLVQLKELSTLIHIVTIASLY